MKYFAKFDGILSRSCGKSVLHLGCVGTTDCSTDVKVAMAPSTLHVKLSAVARVIGVDSCSEAVEEYRRTGICDNILIGDVEELGQLDCAAERSRVWLPYLSTSNPWE